MPKVAEINLSGKIKCARSAYIPQIGINCRIARQKLPSTVTFLTPGGKICRADHLSNSGSIAQESSKMPKIREFFLLTGALRLVMI